MVERQQKIFQYCAVIALIALGAATRFLPHPANMTAVGATAIFAGIVFPKRWGIWLPLLIMIVSDVFIGWHKLVLFTWGSMAMYVALGWMARKKKNTGTVLMATIIGSTQFFLITNWAVWQFEVMYPHTVSGLISSYVAGFPFYRNMFIGDLFYVGVLFGLYALAQQFAVRRFRNQSVTNLYE